MPRLVELIRHGAAPASMVRRAAQGELALPAAEMIEILVLLSRDGELGGEAQKTLAAWEESSLQAIASDATTRPEVLRYLARNHAGCVPVVEALGANAALPLRELEPLAAKGGEATVRALLRSERVRASVALLDAMEQNPASVVVRTQLEALRTEAAESGAAAEQESDAETEAALAQALAAHENAPEEDEKPFELVRGAEGEADELASMMERGKQGGPANAEDQKKLSILQKIGKMRVGERIKLAMRGGREERMILIRDRSKLVSTAVLSSPKVNDSEMETFAAMKNVQEAVLRTIAGNRKNMKLNGVVRALVNNPKTPLDVSLRLLPFLLLKDLQATAVNKNINETVRKLALKMYRTKTAKKKD